MEQLALVILCTLGAAGLAAAGGLAMISWVLAKTEKEKRSKEPESESCYVLRGGVIYEEHDVSGLLEED